MKVANDQYSIATISKGFQILPAVPIPQIASLEFANTAPGEMQKLSVRGTGFLPETQIRIGHGIQDIEASHYVSPFLIEITLKSDVTGEYDIEAFTRDDRRSIFSGKLVLVPFPLITEISPERLDPGAEQTITIKGTGFRDDTQVRLVDGTILKTEYISQEQLECQIPSRLAGTSITLEISNNEFRQMELATTIQIRHELPIVNEIIPIAIAQDSEDREVCIKGGPFFEETELSLIINETTLPLLIKESSDDTLIIIIPEQTPIGRWSLQIVN
ncbi:MAG: IPT/TIG domain-containing protein, partial [bacterium]